jgi:TRAP-type C4-dicarboxylate transport system permease small subunit
MSGRAAKLGRRIRDGADRLERAILTLLVTAMVMLAALQILLRNLWQTGFPWAEPLLGMGLLWLTMLGALAAAGRGKHIAIDLAAALLPSGWSGWIRRVTSLFAAVACGVLAWTLCRIPARHGHGRTSRLAPLEVFHGDSRGLLAHVLPHRSAGAAAFGLAAAARAR